MDDLKTLFAGGIHAPLAIVRGDDDDAREHVRRTHLPAVQIGGIPDEHIMRRDPYAVRLRIWIPALPGRDDLAMIERDRFVYGTIGGPPSAEKVDAAAEELSLTRVQFA